MRGSLHLPVLLAVVSELEPLKNELVYTGGSVISTYITEPLNIVIRATEDVDCIVEAQTTQDYYEVGKRLRLLGFSEDMNSDVLCRFRKGKLILDLMTTEPQALGFTNRWYEEGFKNKVKYQFKDGFIFTLTAVFAVATKFEAFKGRGEGEYRESHDIEDIVAIFEGRPEIVNEIQNSKGELKKYLVEEIKGLLSQPFLTSILEAHISHREDLQIKTDMIVQRLKTAISKPVYE